MLYEMQNYNLGLITFTKQAKFRTESKLQLFFASLFLLSHLIVGPEINYR